jgi:hypothetical protein
MNKFKRILIVSTIALASTMAASLAIAQTDTNTPPPVTNTNGPSTGLLSDIFNSVKASGLTKATNWSIDPYATYAPNVAKGSKIGGGLFLTYNVNQYVGAGLGVDYLGQFSIVSANVSLKYATHPLGFLGSSFTNIAVIPFGIAGIGKATGGTSSGAIAVTDVGAYIAFGHLWGGQFDVGAAYGRWDNAGDYSGVRYHIFAGWSRGF